MLQCDAGQHGRPVPNAGDLGRIATDRALPDVPVGVYHARDNQTASRVDHLRVPAGGRQGRADSGDDAVGDKDVADGKVVKVRVDSHDVAALDQQFFRHDLSPFASRAFSAPVWRDRDKALCAVVSFPAIPYHCPILSWFVLMPCEHQDGRRVWSKSFSARPRGLPRQRIL